MLKSKQQASYPVSKNMLPQDIESRLKSCIKQNSSQITTLVENKKVYLSVNREI